MSPLRETAAMASSPWSIRTMKCTKARCITTSAKAMESTSSTTDSCMLPYEVSSEDIEGSG